MFVPILDIYNYFLFIYVDLLVFYNGTEVSRAGTINPEGLLTMVILV